MSERGRLSGQVAIVTGGGSGVGRSIALALSAEGASVAVAGRRAANLGQTIDLSNSSSDRMRAIPTDVADEGSVRALVMTVCHELGAPTLLVNAAGELGPVGAAWECDLQLWWRSMEVNLRGTMLCCAAVVPSMLAGEGGRIINIASRFGLRAAPGATAYACAKAAVLRLTDSLAAELQASGVYAFAIAPGPIRTALTEWPAEILRWQPDLAEREWTTAARACDLTIDLATGKYDALTGRYLHVDDDRGAMLRDHVRLIKQDAQALRLRSWVETQA